MFLTRFTSPLLSIALSTAVIHSTMAQEVSKPLTQEERSAIDAFATDMQGIKDWVSKKSVEAEGTEASELITRRELTSKLAKVRTTGIPVTMGKAFSAYVSAETEHAKLYAEMPSGEAGLAWLEAMRHDEKRRTAFDSALSNRLEAQDALIGVAADHGISSQVDLFNAAQIFDRWVVILGSDKNFTKAKASALEIAKATKIPFSMNDMIYDKKGLRLPDNYEDEVLAGSYIQRRHNTASVNNEVIENHISIENSGDYGFEPGMLIIVGKIADTPEDAEREILRFKPFAPKVRVAKAAIYMGCMH